VWDRKTLRVVSYGTHDCVTVVEGECDDVLLSPLTETRTRKNVTTKAPPVKMTAAKAREIADRARNGVSPKELANEFRVGVAAIYKLLAGLTWSTVTGMPD